MFKTPEDLLKYLKDEAVEFVDIRFCDLIGQMQHFNVPAHAFTEDAFTVGRRHTRARLLGGGGGLPRHRRGATGGGARLPGNDGLRRSLHERLVRGGRVRVGGG